MPQPTRLAAQAAHADRAVVHASRALGRHLPGTVNYAIAETHYDDVQAMRALARLALAQAHLDATRADAARTDAPAGQQ